MESRLLKVFGKEVASPEVQEVMQRYNLAEVQEDPPFRRYYISREKGLDILAENERVVDIQIFVQPKKRFLAFGETLPFGIQKGMNQAQVHQLLGSPTKSDAFDSQYELPELGAILTVGYDDSSTVNYINVGMPMG